MTILAPEETPILSSADKKKASSTFVEWTVDSLAAPSTSGISEGADVTAFTDQFAGRAKLGNRVQKFRRDYMVSDMQEAVDSVGPAKIAQAEAKAIRELKRDIEATLASANTQATENGAGTANALGGLGDWIQNAAGSGNVPEEELQKLRASINAESNDPLKGTQKVKNNPYGNIDTLEGIQEKADEVNGIVEWAEDVLFNADGYGPEDVVTEVEGKELTKADIRKSLLNARKSRDKFLPAQLKTIQSKQHGQQLKGAFEQKAQEELSWMKGEDNDTRKQYEAMINDPRFAELEGSLEPDISAQLPYIIAHAANSIYGRKPVVETKQSARLNPPKQPTGAGAQSERKVSSKVKKVNEYKNQFSKTGSKSDFVTLRTLQLQNR